MAIEKVETLVVGGGQAGLAMSEHLSACGEPHLVLERDRIAERWRTGRWDSLVANGPAWHDRFPTMTFTGIDPDAFPGKESVADYFVAYALQIKAPIRCGVAVKAVRRNQGRPGFHVETSEGVMEAGNVVAATGPFQRPVMPGLVPADAGLEQMHSYAYRNPGLLPDGAVLVVGAGSSGAQIAEELLRAGRRVYLSVGPHERPPRSYRGRDFVWWLGVLGKWDAEAPAPGMEHVTIAVSGADGGHTVDFRRLAAQGMTLVGRTQSFASGKLTFADDLGRNLAQGDAYYLSLLDEADAYVARNGLDLPEDPDAREIGPDPDCVTHPVRDLDLAEAGISSIIWATGFALDFSWLQVDAFDENGRPKHQRGVSREPGIYFLGLPWLSRRGSSFIWGVWHDAKHLADHIATQRKYLAYRPSEQGNGAGSGDETAAP
jgi:putative flavoprotein involved in K+ transport